MRPKIVYILPFYEEGTDTHLFYNYLLIKEASKKLEIFVVTEKDQKFKWPPLRFLEILFLCFKLRFLGYRNFYVHYSYYGALAAWLATWKPGFQVNIFYWNRGMPWLFKRGWFEERVFGFILRHVILVTGPESLAKEYQKRYGVKEYRILSNWVDVARFAPSEAKKYSKTILFVHHLSKRKGADLVPKIAKGFGSDVKILMIGEGPEYENLKLEIRNLKLENIKLLGKISNSEIPKYFQDADIFLMPSREEGSPHVLLEAMASGTPFVASDVGGVRELVPKALEKFLCAPEDAMCFQEKIKTLLSEPELYNQAREFGLNHVKNFDVSKGVSEFVNLFK